MEILEVEFTYDSFFKKSQVISFDKNKICLIGENGVGKTTLLRILDYVLGKMNNTNIRYGLDKIDYTIKVSLSEEEFNSFFCQLEYSKENSIFYLRNENANGLVVNSRSISQEFDKVREKITILNKNYKKLLAEYFHKYEEFAVENGFESSKIPPLYQLDYIDKRCFEQILDCKEKFLDNDTLTVANGSNQMFFMSLEDSLFINYKVDSDSYKGIRDFFSAFIKYGESKVVRLTDQFIKENKSLEIKIFSIIREIQYIEEKFNLLFSKYNGLFTYIKSNYKRNIRFLAAMNYDNNNYSKDLFHSILYRYKDIYYKEIYKTYEKQILSKKISKDLIYHMIKLGAFLEEELSNAEYSKKIDYYNDSNVSLEDIEEYIMLRDNRRGVLSKLEKIILSRNISKDFEENFNGLYFGIEVESIISDVEKELNMSIPQFESNNIEFFKVEENNGNINVLFKEKGRDELTNISDTSSGRQWFYFYKMLLNQLEEDDIFIIDEPASFLHLKAQREILDKLLSLKQTVIYTTHSPLLLALDYNQSTLYSLRKKHNTTEVLKIEEGLDDEIIEVFGLNEIRSIIIKSFNKVILISDKQKKKLNEKGIIIDMNEVVLIEDKAKYKKITDFLKNYKVSYQAIIRGQKLETFKIHFPRDTFYGFGHILQYYERNKTSVLMSDILKGVEPYESNN